MELNFLSIDFNGILIGLRLIYVKGLSDLVYFMLMFTFSIFYF